MINNSTHRISLFWSNSIFILLFLYSPFHNSSFLVAWQVWWNSILFIIILFSYAAPSSSSSYSTPEKFLSNSIFNLIFYSPFHQNCCFGAAPSSLFWCLLVCLSSSTPELSKNLIAHPSVWHYHLSSILYSTPLNFFLLVKLFYFHSSFNFQRLLVWWTTQNSFFWDK
jgi:hypothetical protein